MLRRLFKKKKQSQQPNAQHDFLSGKSGIVTTTRSQVKEPERHPGGLSRIHRLFHNRTDKSSPPSAD